MSFASTKTKITLAFLIVIAALCPPCLTQRMAVKMLMGDKYRAGERWLMEMT